MSILEKLAAKINKKEPVLGSLSKAGENVITPTESKASQLLLKLSQKRGFEPDAQSMEYKGSTENAIFVRSQIAHRFGDDHAEEYEPMVQVRPKTAWLQAGYLLNPGEKPLCHIFTFRNRKALRVALYHELQLHKT